MIDFDAMLRKKEAEHKASLNQKPAEMPHANISIPKMDAIKNFFEDREYDGKPVKIDGIPSMAAVNKMIREEQNEEFMHRDDKLQTFHFVKETNNLHPYDAYFQRKREND